MYTNLSVLGAYLAWTVLHYAQVKRSGCDRLRTPGRRYAHRLTTPSADGAGGGVVVGVGGLIGIWATAALVACDLVQDFGEGLDVEWFGQV